MIAGRRIIFSDTGKLKLFYFSYFDTNQIFSKLSKLTVRTKVYNK